MLSQGRVRITLRSTRRSHTPRQVVTADRELSNRCRSAARTSGRKLQLVSPASLLADLERVGRDAGDVMGAETATPLFGLAAEVEAEIEAQIVLGGAVAEAEARLRRKRYSPRKRDKLSRHLAGLQASRATQGAMGGPSPLDRLTAVADGMERETQD